ncbi:MAG: HAD family hydrolase, partial [Planctomycetota bacterium]
RWAEQLIRLLDVEKHFHYKEIYPSEKTRHFRSLQNDSGIAYENMLFFDDEPRNIRDVSRLGVTCIHVSDGVDFRVVEDGIRQFSD